MGGGGYKDTSVEHLNYGFIAQEVERVMPDIVSTSDLIRFPDLPDTSIKTIKSMNYQGLIAPLVANMQWVNEENAQIKKDNAQKTAQIKALSEGLLQKEVQIKALSQTLHALQEQVQQLINENQENKTNKKKGESPAKQSAILE